MTISSIPLKNITRPEKRKRKRRKKRKRRRKKKKSKCKEVDFTLLSF